MPRISAAELSRSRGPERTRGATVRSFPFDKIKIDRSFINGLSDGSTEAVAIVGAMTQMGLSLGMSTTAEGVETVEQRDIVRAAGCTEVQGYLNTYPSRRTKLQR